jgi:hypothetical protein
MADGLVYFLVATHDLNKKGFITALIPHAVAGVIENKTVDCAFIREILCKAAIEQLKSLSAAPTTQKEKKEDDEVPEIYTYNYALDEFYKPQDKPASRYIARFSNKNHTAIEILEFKTVDTGIVRQYLAVNPHMIVKRITAQPVNVEEEWTEDGSSDLEENKGSSDEDVERRRDSSYNHVVGQLKETLSVSGRKSA